MYHFYRGMANRYLRYFGVEGVEEKGRVLFMGTSIKRSVMVRVVVALLSMVLFSFVTTYNIFRIQNIQVSTIQANTLLDRAQKAEEIGRAHV